MTRDTSKYSVEASSAKPEQVGASKTATKSSKVSGAPSLQAIRGLGASRTGTSLAVPALSTFQKNGLSKLDFTILAELPSKFLDLRHPTIGLFGAAGVSVGLSEASHPLARGMSWNVMETSAAEWLRLSLGEGCHQLIESTTKAKWGRKTRQNRQNYRHMR